MIFLPLASFNLGLAKTPTTYLHISGTRIINIEFSSREKIDSLYILSSQDPIRLRIQTLPNGEIFTKEYFIDQGYYSWNKFDIKTLTDKITLSLDHSDLKIFEVIAINTSGDRIEVSSIQLEGSNISDAKYLYDEQECFENPPTFLSETYFDEIYFVRTAQEYLNLEEPYEWTHPPLGKLLIASGIMVFSFSPFGWRMMGVLFASLMVPVIYIFAKKIFKSGLAAAVSSFLLAFDFLHFTMARVGTVDTFLVSFSLISTLFFYSNFERLVDRRKPDYRSIFLGILFFSLAFAVKWTALYGLIGQFVLILVLGLKESFYSDGRVVEKTKSILKPILTILGFSIVGGFIYLSTYIPYLFMGHSLMDVYELQWRMFSYHTGLHVTHPYSSEWWMWPFMIKPLWLFYAELPNGLVSTITALGNPIIWWVGFPLVFLSLWRGVKEKRMEHLFLASIFLFQWIPYLFISRCLFIYHYYSNIPLMILTSSGFLSEFWGKPKNRRFVKIYLIAVVSAFILFYPVISGYPVPHWFKEALRLFRSWAF
ncbi:MAG: glycosyltransferase family 39 protein [Candidatus Bathyarchaeia archaeon]